MGERFEVGSHAGQRLELMFDARLCRRDERSVVCADGAGSVADVDLSGSYTLKFELGKPSLFNIPRNATPEMTTNAVIPRTETMSGPEWFKRMDRNRDGDVSRREFPGPIPMFLSIDIDQDGLISLEVAQAVVR